MKLKRKQARWIIGTVLALMASVIVVVVLVFTTNMYMVQTTEGRIVPDEQLKALKADCVIILGAGVYKDNKPSPMLKDRLDEGERLYKAGIASKILVTGDHGQSHYDEVNVMKKYLINAGVPSKDIFMDHAGFTTYDSMYRARDVFGVKKAIVVTQEYHMYRALYICDSLGIKAYGANAAKIRYPGTKLRTVREWLARDKAILSCLFNAKPKYLGVPIDIHGNGDVTND